MANTLIGFVIGCAIGAGGYALYEHSEANVRHECSSTTTEYECAFFNMGKGLGAMCVRVVFERAQEPDKYVKKVEEKSIAGNQICSGPLTQGQNSVVKGKGFFGGGTGTNGAEYCSIKGSSSPLAGCTMTTVIVAQTG